MPINECIILPQVIILDCNRIAYVLQKILGTLSNAKEFSKRRPPCTMTIGGSWRHDLFRFFLVFFCWHRHGSDRKETTLCPAMSRRNIPYAPYTCIRLRGTIEA